MDYDLRDVLDSVTAEAPPARLSADDAIAAGRSLQRRRRYGWTGGIAVVAALAVAGVMASPYLFDAADPDDAIAADAADTISAASAVDPAPATFPTLTAPFMYSIKGYSVGPLHVSDPVFATAAYQESIVTLDGVEKQKVTNSAGTWERSYDTSVGTVTVYRPGVFKPDKFSSGTPVRVRGLPGLQTEFEKQVFEMRVRDRKEFSSHTVKVPALAWQYADGAWATIVANQLLDTADPARDLLALADGLTPAAPTVARVPYRLGSAPAGYHLVGIGKFNPTNAGDSISEAYFSKRAVPVTNLTGRLTEDDLMPASGGGLKIIVTETAPAAPSDPNPHPNPRSPCQENFCDRAINAGYFAEVMDSRNRVDVVRKVTNGLVFDNPTDPTTWHDAGTIGLGR
ncbi:hypothetical protein ACFP2T_17115 [Plantactinospora solaniradicis]|uniref:DUF4179 domain-containing protein n=1 Tax=Plantactinospora solaniradicis TaxID=1723736 RepID=A0ABW1K8J7_9ACTN